MSERIKNYLGMAIIAAVLLLGAAAMKYAGAYERSVGPAAYRTFLVKGVGEIVAIPDIASFTFKILTEGGKDVAALQTQNTEKANAIIS